MLLIINTYLCVLMLLYFILLLQILCDSTPKLYATPKFIHCYVGQPRSIYDMCVFRLSGVQTMCADNYFSADSHIIGDAAYSLWKHGTVQKIMVTWQKCN